MKSQARFRPHGPSESSSGDGPGLRAADNETPSRDVVVTTRTRAATMSDGGAILDGSALRNAVATSCSARAIAARKPPPSPCPSPTSPPRPRPRRCNASPRPTARTRGREARTPPPPSIPPRPCAANLTPLASCPPQIPPPLATKPRTPRRLVSPCPRHIPREDDERRERARRDRASGAERVIGRELPSRVDEHSLNVSLHTTGRAIDR